MTRPWRPGIRLTRALITGAVWMLSSAAVAACPICFQAEDAGVANGVRAAVLVLGGVTVCVLAGVGLFVRRLVRAETSS
jgi:hypothetical protein